MGYFVSTWACGGFFLDAAGGVGGVQYGKWNICQGPQPYYWGGTWLAVNANTDNTDEARDFLLSTCGNEYSMKEYAVNKPDFVNNMYAMDSIINNNYVLDPNVAGNFKNGQNYLSVFADNAERINAKGIITEYDATISYRFLYTVKEEYLNWGSSWDSTLVEFRYNVSSYLPNLYVW